MSAERPSREVAYRLFATEFEDADYSFAESDEERAPNYVVTPGGARINRVFVVGVLTEVEAVSDDVVRARIVDPTGAFVVYAGQYQPDALAFFERAEPPLFVAVTGKARTFQPEGSDRVFTSIRPESVNEVTAETRDRWVVQTAEHTLDRIETFAAALDRPERGDDLTDVLAASRLPPGLASGIPRAIDHYGTTTGYLAALRDTALDAARVVANEIEEVERRDVAPDEGDGATLDVATPLPESPFATDVPDETDVPPTGEPTPDATEGAADAETGEEEEAVTADAGTTDADERNSEPEPDAEPSVSAVEPGEGDADAGETDEMYELSEEEREEVKDEFGVDFETGNEVEAPGEADIDAPGPDDDVDAPGPNGETGEPDESGTSIDEPGGDRDQPGVESEEEEEPEGATGADDTAAASPAEDLDLETVVVETMDELDDGDGAPRDAIVETVRDEHGVEAEAVEDAIQDALMGGRCYESGDDRFTSI
ncbi:MAG: hypothetical protein ABEJ76_06115 [Halanaeroarchaeum sp.]